MSFEIVNPEALGAPRGWNNGMLAAEGGRVLFVAGQIGVGEGAAPGLAGQFGAALARVKRVVEGAGGGGGGGAPVADIGRLTIFVTDMDAYRGSRTEIGAEYRAVFGKHFPAMSLVAVTELVDPRAVVEIEATAVITQAQRDRSRTMRDATRTGKP